MANRLSVRDELLSFAAAEPLHAALFLTYSFDGKWFEEAIVSDLYGRPIETMLIVRDRNAIISEAPSVRYRKANACRSSVFHPKLALLVAEDKARAVIGSANLTRGGFERQRELGCVFNLGSSDLAEVSFFQSLIEYLKTGISQEVRGDSRSELDKVIDALGEVVKKYEEDVPCSSTHVLLHNYAKSIWTQLLERVPHKVLRRAVIVSPFFEPDRKHPEDPPPRPKDASIFDHIKDFKFDVPKGEPTVSIYFRQSEGRTELPVRKVEEFHGKITCFAQNEKWERLHAKLVLFEGANGNGREAFLLALHGSPNFTAAGLLKRAPHGNSELAVLTTLPAKQRGIERSVRVLGLEEGFTSVQDMGALHTEATGEPLAPSTQGAADVTYRVAERTLKVSLLEPAPAGSRVRVLLERNSGWASIGEAEASGATEVVLPVDGLAEIDERTEVLKLREVTLRVEVVAADGTVLVSNLVPVNVDVPQEFCGLMCVGTAICTLDERIARAGLGLMPSYREQQKWLEARKVKGSTAASPVVINHQADLDRFYRNIHLGLRGITKRTKASTELAARRNLDELTRWAVEAVTDKAEDLTCECRLFLIGRLLSCVTIVIDNYPYALKARRPIISMSCLTARLDTIVRWLGSFNEPALKEYAKAFLPDARRIAGMLASEGTRREH